MKANPKISVIVPVYNVEPYIRKSLDSVANQTYYNLEIICVDDGSTDSSGIILDEYVARDKRFIVLHKPQNSGYPHTVNMCLDRITGDYVAFTDPDDWQELNYYENAMNALTKTDADIYISNFYKNYPDGKEEKRVDEPSRDIAVLTPEETLLHMYRREGYYAACVVALWNKVFKSKFFMLKPMGHNLRISEATNVGGDSFVTSSAVTLANKIVYDGNPYYHYFYRESSLVNVDFAGKISALSAIDDVRSEVLRNVQFREVIPYINKFYAYHAYRLAVQAKELNNVEMLETAREHMRKYADEYIVTNRNYPERIQQFSELLR